MTYTAASPPHVNRGSAEGDELPPYQYMAELSLHGAPVTENVGSLPPGQGDTSHAPPNFVAEIAVLPPEFVPVDQVADKAPQHLYSEIGRVTNVEASSTDSGSQPMSSRDVSPESNRSFAAQANDLINAMLNRCPEGSSVIDPESVLGESGRLYHGYKDGTYYLPNDAAEQDRLDFQHTLMMILLDGWLALAPMTRAPSYVLDIGTGTGIWALEFAERNPSSMVIGTDLSAIQPDPRFPNCTFVKDDSEEPWVFPAPHPPDTNCTFPCEHKILFDYVHLRLVNTSFDDTRTVMRHALDNMTPGGWIEFQDIDFDAKDDSPEFEGSAWQKLAQTVAHGAALMGRDVNRAKYYKQWLEEVGFVDVTERHLMLPYNPWPEDEKLKQVGHYNLRNMLDGLRGICWKMLSFAGLGPEEIEKMTSEAEEYIKDTRHHTYVIFYVIYGRKPLK
ncbi:S-adenosyl-L-methionine-dependent methyltransferase [Xylariales sp. PMI_506]|nr:S-adenosyl-L-methionine-dependent methyltransferase [Xylariales sp. PMI_506]